MRPSRPATSGTPVRAERRVRARIAPGDSTTYRDRYPLISFHRDDLNQAEAAVAAACQDLAGRDSLYRSNWAAWPHALLQEASGQPARALKTMTAPWEDSTRLGISAEDPVVGADLVRLATAEGDAGLARQVAAAVGDVASRNDLAWLRSAALRCQGLAENGAHALAAADAYAGASRPLELALASEDAAAAFVKQGDPGRARPLLELTRSRAATAVLLRPSAHASTIRAHSASPCAVLRRVAHPCSVRRSASESTSGSSLLLPRSSAHRGPRATSPPGRVLKRNTTHVVTRKLRTGTLAGPGREARESSTGTGVPPSGCR
jgi:hypothetical protein